MKTAIIYSSKHGTTAKVARLIEDQLLDEEVSVMDLRKNSIPDITGFDRVIIGGSIHAGTIQRRVQKFCEQQLESLLRKKEVGLFICCMQKEQEQEELENAYPKSLQEHSKTKGILGGEFLFEQMNFLERFLVRKLAKTSSNVSRIDYEAIDRFVKELQGN